MAVFGRWLVGFCASVNKSGTPGGEESNLTAAWRGRRFELIDLRPRWGQWRLYYIAAEGQVAYLPAAWTDTGPRDPFV